MNIGQSLLSRKRNSSPAFIPDLIFNMVCGCGGVSSLADDKVKQRICAKQANVDSDKTPLLLHAELVTRREMEQQNVKPNTKDGMNWRSNRKIVFNIYN